MLKGREDYQKLNQQVKNSLAWRALEKVSTQLFQFGIAVYLARLLEPSDFGIITIVGAVMAFMQLFVDSGIGVALIQKENVTNDDYNTAFLQIFFVACAIYIICYCSAPWFAKVYGLEDLTIIIRIIAIRLVLGGASGVQIAILTRILAFRKLALVNSASLLISSTVGVLLAYHGWGVWSLVYSQLANITSLSIILWIIVPWRPRFVYKKDSGRKILQFGMRYMLGRIVTELYNNFSTLVIGKTFTVELLSYYTRGQMYPSLLVTSVSGTIDSVIFPALAALKSDRNAFKTMVRRTINITVYIVFPLICSLAVSADLIVNLMLGEKWLPCVPFLRLSCISVILWPVIGINVQALNALGLSGIYMWLEIANKFLCLLALLFAINISIEIVAITQAVVSVIVCLILYPWVSIKYCDYNLREQVKDLYPAIISTLAMLAVIIPIKLFVTANLLNLVLQLIFGSLVYFAFGKINNMNIQLVRREMRSMLQGRGSNRE